jgi:hypothetical protein
MMPSGKTPPTDYLNRILWEMGFASEERERIVEIAGQIHRDPITLGTLIASQRAMTMARAQKIKVPAVLSTLIDILGRWGI